MANKLKVDCVQEDTRSPPPAREIQERSDLGQSGIQGVAQTLGLFCRVWEGRAGRRAGEGGREEGLRMPQGCEVTLFKSGGSKCSRLRKGNEEFSCG